MPELRQNIQNAIRANETESLTSLLALADLSAQERTAIVARAADLVRDIRSHSKPGIMEVFLEEYGLSTEEGIALMCLAEALLRVPDAETIDALIEDKIAPSNWGKHLGKSTSSLVNASTWALLLTGKVLDERKGVTNLLRGLVKRVGEPVIRTAVGRAMREMGRQFVLGRDISEALKNAKTAEKDGYTYSYDMLGEAAMTDADARRYHLSYSGAISSISAKCTHDDIRQNPGISVKLSALHPRYEYGQRDRVMAELVPRTLSLAQLAKSGGMGFNIDAEEADRLDLSLDVIEAVLSDPSLEGWDGFGVVVQGYGHRAPHVIDWLNDLATRLDRRIMVRLVKGAYWDTEIKLAQVESLPGYPVFTQKASTDLSYIACTRKLLSMTDRIYPQFATHNAHTIAAILEMAEDKNSFEFQRLHGMGDALHDIVHKAENTRCRIYAPVGAHRDLLAYLVRRLLENGANSSFVNQIVDADIAPETVAADPIIAVEAYLNTPENPAIPAPARIFGLRENSQGWDITDPQIIAEINEGRNSFSENYWKVGPLIGGKVNAKTPVEILNPANNQPIGIVIEANAKDTETALKAAKPWTETAETRRDTLLAAADLYEANAFEFFALAAREAGKTLSDAVGELREAVDFLRYYAHDIQNQTQPARGVMACISPWNFPLAIFTGQVVAALATGNAVIAKPAETTPIIAYRAVQLLHEAGVPKSALQLLPGLGSVVGAALSSDPRIDGLCFTGSTLTAQRINTAMAQNLSPFAPLIAETGGVNAMIVDSTALPEQAVRDIVASAFQSAGQRCSALRLLYVQEDVADTVKEMLFGAMKQLSIGDPWLLKTDIGPVIDETAFRKISSHIDAAKSDGRLLFQTAHKMTGNFVPASVIQVNGIADLAEEIFGPVLHITTFKSKQIDQIVDDINASGYGLTFGLHTRIDDRVQQIVERIEVGNTYVNRNQIGATVGSQPFGGEGLSGTGPKAGGPHYLKRFTTPEAHTVEASDNTEIDLAILQARIDALPKPKISQTLSTVDLPGPTGESNRLSVFPRGVALCLGPDDKSTLSQIARSKSYGCQAIDARGAVAHLTELLGFNAVLFDGNAKQAATIRRALAKRAGPIIPMIFEQNDPSRFHLERHICIDTTASGGNTALLAGG